MSEYEIVRGEDGFYKTVKKSDVKEVFVGSVLIQFIGRGMSKKLGISAKEFKGALEHFVKDERFMQHLHRLSLEKERNQVASRVAKLLFEDDRSLKEAREIELQHFKTN